VQKLLCLCLLFFTHFILIGQNNPIIADFEVVNGDTLFLSELLEVEVLEFKNSEEKKKNILF
jgi:hypothetical protein